MTENYWIIARLPSNLSFPVHTEISRPLLRYDWEMIDGQAVRVERRGVGPNCYQPVDMVLCKKNQYTDKKREARTERPKACFAGYLFIQAPDTRLMADMIDRGRIYGFIPDIPRAENGYEPGPLRLKQRAIDLMRKKYDAEFDVDTGGGHRVSVSPKALMQPGYEFEGGDMVVTDDPAWSGHKLKCMSVLDTKAKVICRLFGIDHTIEIDLRNLRKAG